MNELALAVSELHFQAGKKVILDQVTFSIRKGTVFAVVGHNGAGKTTLFHLILGLKIQSSGRIELSGRSNLERHARSDLGYVAERPYLNLNFKFRDFLLFHAKLMGIPFSEQQKEVQRVAGEVGLQNHLPQALSTFSKGMLQKTLIAQSMIGNPQVMILDEPMSGLDPEARGSVRAHIQKWKQDGKTIIFSSHALEDVEQLSDEVIILKEGKVQFLGSVQEWRNQR